MRDRYTVMITLLCMACLTLLILIAFALSGGEAEQNFSAPEVNAEGLCKPIKVTAAENKVTAAENKVTASEIKVQAAENKVTAYTDADIVALAQMLYGEARGCTLLNQQQCVWCVLNRVDDARFPDNIIGVVSQPGQFYGYSADFPVWDNLYDVAEDVVQRWVAEKQGANIDRELPSGYLWFTGDGVQNYFRETFQ